MLALVLLYSIELPGGTHQKIMHKELSFNAEARDAILCGVEKLAKAGKYDGVAFHRVIDGFMAQTGDVEFGNVKDFSEGRVGTGGSDFPDIKAEFNDKKHERGTCSMARSASPDSANSQFFICFEPSSFLDRQYTVWGQVVEGMEFVDKIKMGSSRDNGSVSDPDHMVKVTVGRPKAEKSKSDEK